MSYELRKLITGNYLINIHAQCVECRAERKMWGRAGRHILGDSSTGEWEQVHLRAQRRPGVLPVAASRGPSHAPFSLEFWGKDTHIHRPDECVCVDIYVIVTFLCLSEPSRVKHRPH